MADTTTPEMIETIKQGYTFEKDAITLGALLVDGEPRPDVPIRIPLAMLNRHGLVCGATGTGKTKTLQVLAEQISLAGVPVFAADIKGDLSGLSEPGASNEKLLARTQALGQDWVPTASATEFFALGGDGVGIPLRATITAFGPIMLAKVLGLNETQESSLGLVFHYADTAGLPLLDLDDLTSVLKFLSSDEGKDELAEIGGLSKPTVGVILRQIVNLAAQGADAFFGEPEFDSADLLRLAPDGRGIISVLELPNLQDRPALFSTFLMWLLADLFSTLPEVGDADKPRLVFFFDEAHLLFADASKAFLQAIAQTVRLIRSKGVGVFFVTQSPTDVPDEVLAQLGSRVQHALRAHTPNDAKALRATVATYPRSGYDLEQVLTQLGTGEAIVTVMGAKGAPTPVAWTRIYAPLSSMDPADEFNMQTSVNRSQLYARYFEEIDRDSAHEILARKLEEGARAAEAERLEAERIKAEEEAAKQAEKDRIAAEKEAKRRQAEYDKARREAERQAEKERREAERIRKEEERAEKARQRERNQMIRSVIRSPLVRDITRGLFGTGRRR